MGLAQEYVRVELSFFVFVSPTLVIYPQFSTLISIRKMWKNHSDPFLCLGFSFDAALLLSVFSIANY